MDQIVGYVKTISLKPLVVGLISMQGYGKINMSHLFFWGQFQSLLVFPINLDLESHGR